MLDPRVLEKRLALAEDRCRQLVRGARHQPVRIPPRAASGPRVYWVVLTSTTTGDLYLGSRRLQDGVTVVSSLQGAYLIGRRYAAVHTPISGNPDRYSLIQSGAWYVSGILQTDLAPLGSATLRVDADNDVTAWDRWGDGPPHPFGGVPFPIPGQPFPIAIAIAGDRIGAHWRFRQTPTPGWRWEVSVNICSEQRAA